MRIAGPMRDVTAKQGLFKTEKTYNAVLTRFIAKKTLYVSCSDN